MKLQPVLMLLLAIVLATGCDSQPTTPAAAPSISAISPTKSAADSTMPTLEPIPDAPKPTEDSLQGLETRFSCQLPSDYRNFVKANNGVFPSPNCVTFEEAGRKTASDVFCFFAISDDRPSISMDWHLETYSGRLPKNTLPIGRDSCGNLWLLSLRNDNAGSVFFWDHGSYDNFDETDLANWPKIASSFQEFKDNLSRSSASADTAGVPSRYSLVKQANDGMVKQDPEFSTRANPGFVWHCDCDEDGNITMQFVQYEIHAVATHTCGYSRLCAIKGLTKEGQPRLPE